MSSPSPYTKYISSTAFVGSNINKEYDKPLKQVRNIKGLFSENKFLSHILLENGNWQYINHVFALYISFSVSVNINFWTSQIKIIIS